MIPPKALLTLPVGPRETTQQWYAGSRLGVYVCTILVWGAGIPGGGPEVHFYCSRCKEKSPPYSMAVWQDLLSRLDLAPVRDIHWWNDGGKHFRSHAAVTTMMTRALQALCERSSHTTHLHETQTSFGVANHFKNAADGQQAHLKHLLREVAASRDVCDIETMIAECSALHEEHRGDPKKFASIRSCGTTSCQPSSAASSLKSTCANGPPRRFANRFRFAIRTRRS